MVIHTKFLRNGALEVLSFEYTSSSVLPEQSIAFQPSHLVSGIGSRTRYK